MDTPENITPADAYSSEMVIPSSALQKKLRHSPFVNFVNSRFTEYADGRRKQEEIWLNSWRNYRGDYSNTQAINISKALERNPDSCTAFIKITKTKVLAAYGQIIELLFSGNRFPLSVDATPVPEGVATSVFLSDTDVPDTAPEIGDVYGFNGDGKELQPGATAKTLLSGLYDKYSSLIKGKTVNNGASPDPTKYPQINPADEAAKNMDKMIQDQLEEVNAEEELKNSILECVILGTGFLKGPFNYNKRIDKWTKESDGSVSYTPIIKKLPKFNHVSCWNIYPDPFATSVDNSEALIERHLWTRAQVKDLVNRPLFDVEAVKRVLMKKPAVDRQYWEQQLISSNSSIDEDNRFEVREYWGYLDKDVADAVGMDYDEEDLTDSLTQVMVNGFICGDEVLKLVANPFNPSVLHYSSFQYEKNLYSIWGVGLPENTEDTQSLMNTSIRMGVDNLKLSGNVMLEIDETLMQPGQQFEVHAGKIYYKEGGVPGTAINAINIPNTSQQNLMMYDKMRQLTDEVSSLPSYSHGQTGVTGVGRTASGISMLMGAASESIKTVIANIDTALERSGQLLFQWNMQFNQEHVEIIGDIGIAATGMRSVMKKEVYSQRLISLLQIVSGNPALFAMVNSEVLLKELAGSMDLPDKLVNSPQMAALYAEIIGKTNAVQQGTGTQPAGTIPEQGGVSSPAGAIPGQDTTGGSGGTIGVGSTPNPGESGFSA